MAWHLRIREAEVEDQEGHPAGLLGTWEAKSWENSWEDVGKIHWI